MLFETARLSVRPLALPDLPALYAVLSDPEVMRYLEQPFSKAQTEAFIRDCGLARPPLVYGAEEKSAGALAGYLIFHPYDGPDVWELGWVLGRRFWGKGYAAELTGAAVRYAERAGIKALLLECAPGQAATAHIAGRFRFAPIESRDGLLRFLRPIQPLPTGRGDKKKKK